MNPRVLALSLALAAAAPSAQTIYAITDDGDVVALDSNGTWRAADDAELAAYYDLSPAAPVGLGHVYEIDPVLGWRESTSGEAPASEVFLQLGSNPVFAVTVFEDVNYPPDFVRDFVLANARDGGFTPEVLREEHGELDGVETVTLEFRAASESGLPFRFQTTAFLLPQGTLQLSSWTFDALFDRNRDALDELRDAVRILPPPPTSAEKI